MLVSFAAGAAAAAAAVPVASARSPIAAAARSIDAAGAELRAVDAALDRSAGPFAVAALSRRTANAAAQARQGVATLAAALAGDRPTARQRAAIMVEIARGGGVANAAGRLAAEIDASAAARLDRTIAARGASPFSAGFWRAVLGALPRDLRRLDRFMAAQAGATWRGVSIGAAWPALLGLAAAALLLFPIRLRLRHAGERFMIDRAPGSRLRRSGRALWMALLGTVIPWLAVLVLDRAFAAAGMVSAPWQPLAATVVRGVAVAAAVAAVASTLLAPGRGSWRLVPVSDETADVLLPWTFAAAMAVFLAVVVDGVADAAGLSTPAKDIAALVQAALHSAVSVMLLLTISRARRRAVVEAPATQPERDAHRGLAAVALGSLIGWLAVAATFVTLTAGYIPLGLLIARLLLWVPLVAAVVYLALLVTDDLCDELISGESRLGRALHRAFGIRGSVLDQIGVTLSAVLRLVLLVVGGVAAFAPLGTNLGQLGGIADAVANGVTIGQITISPGAILRGLVVLAVGMFVVRAIERWLVERYLPRTELDDGARKSISTVARYVGFILATLWALAALGIGFERIALMLSALSVGIGFGLQAITQNFVSGLILLIERPVKIGDLVQIGDQKGDVKRISVRATEIEVADRSTLIVPNSELITKTVRNLTHANAIGLVQIKFTVPLDVDVDTVRALVLTLFEEAKTVFDDPEPKVMIDSIDDGAVHFNCTAYCSSPRAAYATRSDVLFRLIMELRTRGIAIGSPPQLVAGIAAAPAAPGTAGVVDDGS